jgi:hypothetical protein
MAAVKKLLGPRCWGGKLQKHETASWKLDYCSPVYYSTPAETRDTDDDDTDDENESVESEGSNITVIVDQLDVTMISTLTATTVTPVPPLSPNSIPALQETPPDKRAKMRKKAEDCHVLVHWSSLKQLLKEHMGPVSSVAQPYQNWTAGPLGL